MRSNPQFKGRSEGEIGEIGKVLGMEIMRDRPSRTMTISHRMKIKDLLDSNGMKGCRTSATPLVPKENLKSLKEDPVILKSHPGPKARWTLYVHTQETVSHTLLGVAVCNKTVVSDSLCM